VNGEDNLVAISLSILPANLNRGEVELKVLMVGEDAPLRVWKYPDKRELIIPSNDPCHPSNCERWAPGELPPTLYVEGTSNTLPGGTRLTLSYIIDQLGCIHGDLVTVTVVGVWLYRDGGILDDWPKTATELRSPKYIFGKTDPIYVQVNSLNRTPLQETFLDYVKVTSESGGLQFLNMYYALEHWFNNFYPGELLFLADHDFEDADGYHIKVIDEEVLTFWLEIQPGSGSYRSCKTVMVDRGEFLALAGSETDEQSHWWTWPYYWWISGVPYFNQNISDAKSKMSNDYKWWENGYMIGKYYDIDDYSSNDQQYEGSKLTALDAGGAPPFSCADFLFVSSHGGEGYLVIITTDTKWEVVWDPASTSGGGWDREAEFCIFSACEVLGTEEDPDSQVNNWINNLFPKGLHAVLGTCKTATNEGIDDDFGGFLDKLINGETVVNAYKHACYGFLFNTPYGILVREENLNDYLPPSVSGQYLTRDYTNIDTTFYYFYYDGNLQIINPTENGKHIAAFERYHTIQRKIAEAMEFKEEISIDVLSLDKKEQVLTMHESVRSLFEHSDTKDFSFSGWNGGKEPNIPLHSTFVPEGIEAMYLTSLGLGIPTDYVLDSRGKMMVSKYIPNPSGGHYSSENWCEGETFEFVRKYNGHKIFDDRCIVAIQNNSILSYTLTRHPLKKTGTIVVKKPHFRFKDTSIKQDDLQTSLVYRVKGSTIIPNWQIRYGNYLFHYDIK